MKAFNQLRLGGWTPTPYSESNNKGINPSNKEKKRTQKKIGVTPIILFLTNSDETNRVEACFYAQLFPFYMPEHFCSEAGE